MSWSDVVNGKVVRNSERPSGVARGRWLPNVVINNEYDPRIEKRSGPVVTVEENRVVYEYEIEENLYAVDNLKTSIKQKAGELFDEKVSAITSEYTDKTKDTWSQQKAEADAYTADANAPTPMINAIVFSRGVQKSDVVTRILTKSDVVTRILTKADTYAQAVGSLLGREQAISDLKSYPKAGNAK